MNTSPACLALIRQFEGCRIKAYMPTPHDVPTIGWGATRHADGSAVRLGETWTQAQADAALAAFVARLAGRVTDMLGGHPTTQHQFDAMVSLAYNLGAGALGGSTLMRRHLAGDYAGAAAQFKRWDRQGATVLPGLTRRRAAEAALYRSN